MRLLERVQWFLNSLFPIKKNELRQFAPMALMMLFTLFNYNILRSMKDSLVVPGIGAEAISFIKLYCVVPVAVLFMVIYAKMTNTMSQQRIFYTWCIFFLTFFLVFAFILYPYRDFFHPNPEDVKALANQKLDIFITTLDLSHFKWFLKIYGKWLYALFYVLAELWGSLMLSLLFWQFANHITKTENAKRFYPMYGLVGNFGLILAGLLIKGFSEISQSATAVVASQNVEVMITALMVCASIAIIVIMYLYHNINTEINKNPDEFLGSNKKKNKPKLSLIDGFKVIFSSKYLGFVAILVLSYGISINLVEGPWKAKVRELYPDTNQYAYFMGNLTLLTGISSMTMMLIGAHVLPRIRWFSGAILTPLILFISGLGFFVFVVFDDAVHSYIDLVLFDPLWLAVIFGLILNALSKATKYSFFDPTKEMSYIPIDNELKTKGKAAVDIVGARVAKSFGALIPSTLFVLFPDATFSSITPYLMVIFIVISLLWLVDVKFLSVEYENRLAENKASGK